MHQCGIELPKLIYNSIVATSIARSAVPCARPALIIRCAATTERAGERARIGPATQSPYCGRH